MKNQATKTELRKTSRFMMMAVAGLALAAQSAWSTPSTDGGPSAALARQEAPAQGRALLTIEDLKTLLGVNARDPSAVRKSQPEKDVAAGSYDFILGLSAQEKQALVAHINRAEAQRAELVAQLEKDVAAQKTELRSKRRGLQNSRISADGANDEALGRRLFESLITEANIEARNARVLEKFDHEHVVAIDFERLASGRVVNTIAIGDAQVWSLWGNAHQVAQK